MASLAYRLRVRNASDSADALVFSSVATDAAPYIVDPPSGDGQEVDLVTGAVRTGAYTITVQDVATGSDGTGVIRAITNALEDAGNRQQLLSRRAYIEVSRNGGTSWTEVLIAGYLTNLQQSDAITYTFTVSDSRRVEATFRAFTWASAAEQTAFPRRGCLVGGPIKGGFGSLEDLGGWDFTVFDTEGSYLALAFQSGYIPPQWVRSSNVYGTMTAYVNKLLEPFAQAGTAPVNLTQQAFSPLVSGGQYVEFPALQVEIEKVTAGGASLGFAYGSLKAFFPLALTEYTNGLAANVYVQKESGVSLTAGDRLRLRVISTEVTESSPLYIDEHPVDIVTKLYDLAAIPYDAASAAAMKAAMGATVRYAMRITTPKVLGEFLNTALFGPLGFATRTNDQGKRVFFSTRRVGSGTPAYTINTADVQGDAPPVVFDLDEATVATSYRFKYRTYGVAITSVDSNVIPPSDGIVESVIETVVESGDVSTYSTREISFDMPGMLHDATNFSSAMAEWIYSESRLGFDRFGRGAPTILLPVIATSAAAAAQVGDEVNVNVSYYPNKNYRIGESTVGSRVAQVVRREETPEGPILKLVDSGLTAQVGTAATISIAASATNPRTLAAFTITNAATLNAGTIGVEVEWGTGSSAPDGGQILAYAGGSVPTTAITLPPVTPGTKVWVRARGIQPMRRASAWTAWTSVTLTGFTAPSSLVLSAVTATSLTATWAVGSTEDQVVVFVAPGSVAPSDWKPYRVGLLMPNSTSIVVPSLSPSTAYIVGVAHRDAGTGGLSTVVTATTTTLATSVATAPRIAGLQFVTYPKVTTDRTGVVLALYPAAGGYQIVIERAPDSGGSPGSYSTLAVVDADVGAYTDLLPADGAVRWYRVKHRLSGYEDSAYSTAISTAPYGIPLRVSAPPASAPTITPDTVGTSTDFTMTISTVDPQYRILSVEFREKVGAGAWSAWTVDAAPYSKTASLSGTNVSTIGWRVNGYDNNGALVVLRQGDSSWPLNLGVSPTINKLTRSNYNSGTGKYEIWFRYYIERGNGTLEEDPLLGLVTFFGPTNIKDQSGASATGLAIDTATKQADGWYASWNSTGTQQWTFELTSYGLFEELYFPGQNSDEQTVPLPVVKGSASIVLPAGQPSASGAVTGSGTTGKLPKWSSSSALTDSILTESGTKVTAAGTLAATTAVETPLVQNSGALLGIGTVTAHTLDFFTNNVLHGRFATTGIVTFTQAVVSGANYGANFGNGYFFANAYSGADPWFGGWNNNATAGNRRSMLYMGTNTKLGLTDDSGGYSRTALEAVRGTGLLYIGGDSAAGTLFNSVTIAPIALFGAATTSRASIRLPHGTAPSAPTNGDFWSTTAGFYGRVNGTTIGPFGTGNGNGDVVGPASATDNAVVRFDLTTGKLVQNSVMTVGDNGLISLNGLPFGILESASNYNLLYRRDGGIGIYLGGAGDQANYYDNTLHNFRDASGNQKARITGTGRFGIGVDPSFVIDAYSAADAVVRLRGGTGTNEGGAYYVTRADTTGTLYAAGDRSRIFGGTPDVNASIYTGAGIPLLFDVAGVTQMTITAAGTLRFNGTSTLSGWGGVEFANVAGFGLKTASLNYGLYGSNGSTLFVEIDSGGNVGVGATPTAKLDVRGNILGLKNGAAHLITSQSDTQAVFRLVVGSLTADFTAEPTYAYLRTIGAYPLLFGTNSAEQMRLTSAGDLGIGTTGPGVKLDVVGSIRSQDGTQANIFWQKTGADALQTYLYNFGTESGMYDGTNGRFVWRYAPGGNYIAMSRNRLFINGGAREFQFDSSTGMILTKGEAGGWAFGHHAIGSSNTDRGGFGWLGSGDTLSYYYIGAVYNAAQMYVYPSGQVAIGNAATSNTYGLQINGASSAGINFYASSNTADSRNVRVWNYADEFRIERINDAYTVSADLFVINITTKAITAAGAITASDFILS